MIVPGSELLTYGIIAAFGLCIGSFLNVCIYRLPREISVVQPPSNCPRCKRAIAWYENIPVLSYVALGARCRGCKEGISWRYPAVELLTGITAVVCAYCFGFTAASAVYFAFLSALIAVSVIDIDFQIIPDEISVGGMVVGMLLSVLVPQLHGTDSRLWGLGFSLIGILVGGGVLYGTAIIGDFLFRKESMGGGDIKLLAMAGSILGWKAVLLTFFLAPMVALVPGLVVLAFKRSSVIPYGPFLSIGLAAALFYGDEILRLTGVEESYRFLWEYYRG